MKLEHMDEIINGSKLLGAHSLQINKETIQLELRKNRFRLIAVSEVLPNEVFGFADFYSPKRDFIAVSNLVDHLPGVDELSYLQIDPKYFRCGLGSLLLDYAKRITNERKRRLLVKPQKPGEDEEYQHLSDEEKNIFSLDQMINYICFILRGVLEN